MKFSLFLRDANGSPQGALNALVLRIEKLTEIATPDIQTDRTKIATLMTAIETTQLFITSRKIDTLLRCSAKDQSRAVRNGLKWS